MTIVSRPLALLAMAVALLACGDDDDATGSNGSGGSGSSGQALDWDTFCSKEEAQYATCKQEYAGCQTRCIDAQKPDSARLAVYQTCLLGRSCDQLGDDDECYVTAALPDLAKATPLIDACGDLQKKCKDAGNPLFKSGDTCLAIYSTLVDASVTAPLQACLAAHQDCASAMDCLQDPNAKLQALFDESKSCQTQLAPPK